ncbi:hypothetical protein [Streptomyces sp. NBC_01789]|uniref:hypothetical protein n=1 Tax=Streptomyces sp. NBC_01789 TaxID=2975941 RepID=UPI00225909BA|nr:hypothetical protein [Streptomyces sp. NBC_01789]MCX4450694.1 hypothetical protein [Streptomyces sp. NBC_01789]
MDPFVPKRGPRPVGQQLCAYTETGHEEDYCNKPGTWHVMWDGDLEHSFTCDQHMELILQRWMFDDRHPAVGDCGMPGALWEYKGKRCAFPAAQPVAVSEAALEVR